MVRRESSLPDWRGKTVAVDAWNVLYQFLSAIRGPDGSPLTDSKGRITSHLAGIMYRTSNLADLGIKTAWVFDGQPHPLKRETLAARNLRRSEATTAYDEAIAAGDMETARSKAQQTSKMTPEMATQAMDLLRALGMPVIEAPGEGEAQAAWMANAGLVDAAASQDFDALLFGAPKVVRNLTVTGRRKMPGKQIWTEVKPETIDLQESLGELGLIREQLIDVALLVGTDFHPGIKGIGAKKAVQLIKKYGALEPLIEKLSANPESAGTAVERAILEQHEALMDRDTVSQIFNQPSHVDVELEWTKPDAAAVTKLMVDEFGFSQTRVEGALEKFGAAIGKQTQQSLFDF